MQQASLLMQHLPLQVAPLQQGPRWLLLALTSSSSPARIDALCAQRAATHPVVQQHLLQVVTASYPLRRESPSTSVQPLLTLGAAMDLHTDGLRVNVFMFTVADAATGLGSLGSLKMVMRSLSACLSTSSASDVLISPAALPAHTQAPACAVYAGIYTAFTSSYGPYMWHMWHADGPLHRRLC